ncbi:hypothetical protein NDU88_008197 [Pleurodeles waltl]|uniref:Uncharacterized protein n=1 Tax=Pleurodeles waltl TaxID=8319 RepID=A0AAV7SUJ3_PLEWA|nr:hypothetical protein NDU88_008197 [Pleurodeles waltl]
MPDGDCPLLSLRACLGEMQSEPHLLCVVQRCPVLYWLAANWVCMLGRGAFQVSGSHRDTSHDVSARGLSGASGVHTRSAMLVGHAPAPDSLSHPCSMTMSWLTQAR